MGIPNHKLQQARKERFLTQKDLAEKIGTTKVNISRWECGETTPGPFLSQKLCHFFEKSPSELGLLPEDVPSQAGAVPDTHEEQEKQTRNAGDVEHPTEAAGRQPLRLQEDSVESMASYRHRKKPLRALPPSLRIGLVGVTVIMVAGTIAWRLIMLNGGPFFPSTPARTTITMPLQQSPQEIYTRKTSRKPVISDPLTGQDSNHWDTITTATYGCSFRGTQGTTMCSFL